AGAVAWVVVMSYSPVFAGGHVSYRPHLVGTAPHMRVTSARMLPLREPGPSIAAHLRPSRGARASATLPQAGQGPEGRETERVRVAGTDWSGTPRPQQPAARPLSAAGRSIGR